MRFFPGLQAYLGDLVISVSKPEFLNGFATYPRVFQGNLADLESMIVNSTIALVSDGIPSEEVNGLLPGVLEDLLTEAREAKFISRRDVCHKLTAARAELGSQTYQKKVQEILNLHASMQLVPVG